MRRRDGIARPARPRRARDRRAGRRRCGRARKSRARSPRSSRRDRACGAGDSARGGKKPRCRSSCWVILTASSLTRLTLRVSAASDNRAGVLARATPSRNPGCIAPPVPTLISRLWLWPSFETVSAIAAGRHARIEDRPIGDRIEHRVAARVVQRHRDIGEVVAVPRREQQAKIVLVLDLLQRVAIVIAGAAADEADIALLLRLQRGRGVVAAAPGLHCGIDGGSPVAALAAATAAAESSRSCRDAAAPSRAAAAACIGRGRISRRRIAGRQRLRMRHPARSSSATRRPSERASLSSPDALPAAKRLGPLMRISGAQLRRYCGVRIGLSRQRRPYDGYHDVKPC